MNDVLLISSVLLWLVVVFNLLLTFALIRRLNANPQTAAPAQREKGLPAGQPAPDFTAETLTGETVTRATYAGRNLALLFVSPTCGPCREALPAYEALQPAAARAGVILLLVSTADAAQTRAFADELHLRLPILVAPAPSNTFSRDYRIPGTPSYCLVDAAGIVQSAGYPSLEWGEWKALAESWTASLPPRASMAVSEGG